MKLSLAALLLMSAPLMATRIAFNLKFNEKTMQESVLLDKDGIAVLEKEDLKVKFTASGDQDITVVAEIYAGKELITNPQIVTKLDTPAKLTFVSANGEGMLDELRLELIVSQN